MKMTIDEARKIISQKRSGMETMRDADLIILSKGFIEAWEQQQKEIDRLKAENEELKKQVEYLKGQQIKDGQVITIF